MLTVNKFTIYAQHSSEKANAESQTDTYDIKEQEIQTLAKQDKSVETARSQFNTIASIELFEEAIYENEMLKDIYFQSPVSICQFVKSFAISADLVALSESWCIAVSHIKHMIYIISDTVVEYHPMEMITCINPDSKLLGTELGNIYDLKCYKSIHFDAILSIYDNIIVVANGVYKNNEFKGTEELCCSYLSESTIYLGTWSGFVLEMDSSTMVITKSNKLSEYPISSIFVDDAIHACTAFEFLVFKSFIVFRYPKSSIKVVHSLIGCLVLTKQGVQLFKDKKMELVLSGEFKDISVYNSTMIVCGNEKILIYTISTF